MLNSSETVLTPMIIKLEASGPFSDDDKAAILALPHRVSRFTTRHYIVNEGDRAEFSCLLLSGFAYRHKAARTGERQVFSINVKGDLADSQNFLSAVADHNSQALRIVEPALIPVDAVRQIA